MKRKIDWQTIKELSFILLIVATIVGCFCGSLIVSLKIRVTNQEKYDRAVEYMCEGNYEQAALIFEAINFSDSDKLLVRCYEEIGAKTCPYCGKRLD